MRCLSHVSCFGFLDKKIVSLTFCAYLTPWFRFIWSEKEAVEEWNRMMKIIWKINKIWQNFLKLMIISIFSVGICKFALWQENLLWHSIRKGHHTLMPSNIIFVRMTSYQTGWFRKISNFICWSFCAHKNGDTLAFQISWGVFVILDCSISKQMNKSKVNLYIPSNHTVF